MKMVVDTAAEPYKEKQDLKEFNILVVFVHVSDR